MKKLLFISLVSLTSPLLAAPPAGFEDRVEKLRRAAGVPGMAIAIVEDGSPTLTRGFGVRQLGATTPVNADTIFPTGSTGKAVTVAALATLVDAGKIRWDDKVIDHLPGFQMYDPWVTREITIRDLLVHRSGLGPGAGDLLFVPRTNLTRAESVRRIRYIKPATSFRSAFAYSNLMYMVAGQLIEAVSGKTWEDYVREHVLAPINMTQSTSDNDRRFATENRAYPHARLNGAFRGLGDQERLDERDDLGRNAAPGGGLASSATDMAKWIAVQLGHGALPGGGRLYSDAAQQEMWKPAIVQPIGATPEVLAETQPTHSAYALGWEVEDYRGAKIIWHGGAVLGFKTAVVLLPGRKVGFAITINSEEGELIRGLMFELLDHYLGFPTSDWPARFKAYRATQFAEGLKAVEAAKTKPAKVGPTLPLSRYAGTYTDAWYGNVEVVSGVNGLAIDFKSTPNMTGRLQHWQYNTFVTRFTDRSIEPAYVTFSVNQDGEVDRVTMKAASPVADFSWDYHDLLFTPQ
jgi:CubicO group peptidase (beta-lactamase class C family)